MNVYLMRHGDAFDVGREGIRRDADILFKKSAVCCLVFDGVPAKGAARLEWLMQPRHLRCLREGLKSA